MIAATQDQDVQASAEPAEAVEVQKLVCPKSMVSKLMHERRKKKEEMFKKVIGQQNINNFFAKKNENPENDSSSEGILE